MTGFNRYEPPSPSTQGDEELEETFLKDVEYIHDVLPQPFRRIDKILTEIFEQAWMTIEKHENEKQYVDEFHRNLKKVIYEEELLIQDQLHCIAACGDYAVAFGNIGIFVYNMSDLHICAKCSYQEYDVDVAEGTTSQNLDDEEKKKENVHSIYDANVIAYSNDCVLMGVLKSKGLLILCILNSTPSSSKIEKI